MKPPCDEAVIRAHSASVPCSQVSGKWVLLATILATSMAFIDSSVVNVATPALQRSFGASVVDVQWVIESYGLTLSALILLGGSMGDLFGRKRIFVLGVAVFTAASMACGFSATIYQLILARAVQGIGAAFMIPGSLAIISASFDERERGRAVGTWSGSTAVTTAIGPVLGGWLIEHLSWRWAFFINAPVGIVVIAISLWHVPESRSKQRMPLDWLGAMLVTISLSALVFGFIESSSLGWKHPLVLASIASGFAGSGLFLLVESQSDSPMVPLFLFRSRSFAGANLLTFFLYAAISIFFFVFPLNLIQIQRYSASQAGAAVLPLILIIFLLSRWSGGLVDRYGPRLPLIVGPVIAGIGFALSSIPSVGAGYWTTFFPAVLVIGLGMAISIAPLTTVVLNAVDNDRVGTASGINNAVSRIAGLLAIAILGAAMVLIFGQQLSRRLSEIPLRADIRGELQSNVARMAALTLTERVDSQTADTVRLAIVDSFVFGFRWIMWICAALAMVSGGIGFRTLSAESRADAHQKLKTAGASEVPA
jgi:EmrB/QacA subfamily drug resistance transporter